MGFPRFKKKGRDQVVFRLRPERCASNLIAATSRFPVIGTVRTHENTRRIERLIAKGRARVGDHGAP